MDLEQLTIGEARTLAKMFYEVTREDVENCKDKGRYVVIRTTNAGVHVGFLASQQGQTVCLNTARRIWSWSGAFTLSELSQEGISGGRISCTVPEIKLLDAIEVIFCSVKSQEILTYYKEHKNE